NENRVRIADVLVCTSSEAAFFSRPAASLDTRRVESSGFHVKCRAYGTQTVNLYAFGYLK
ncbi:MAG: hypothetical protein LRZ88_06140, partial [Candidatus Cloacimonetes bacterium]|nr:hypothetical protein [Candidatus Cloacimonadota bacterium]